jgi:hypothetical protein
MAFSQKRVAQHWKLLDYIYARSFAMLMMSVGGLGTTVRYDPSTVANYRALAGKYNTKTVYGPNGQVTSPDLGLARNNAIREMETALGKKAEKATDRKAEKAAEKSGGADSGGKRVKSPLKSPSLAKSGNALLSKKPAASNIVLSMNSIIANAASKEASDALDTFQGFLSRYGKSVDGNAASGADIASGADGVDSAEAAKAAESAESGRAGAGADTDKHRGVFSPDGAEFIQESGRTYKVLLDEISSNPGFSESERALAVKNLDRAYGDFLSMQADALAKRLSQFFNAGSEHAGLPGDPAGFAKLIEPERLKGQIAAMANFAKTAMTGSEVPPDPSKNLEENIQLFSQSESFATGLAYFDIAAIAEALPALQPPPASGAAIGEAGGGVLGKTAEQWQATFEGVFGKRTVSDGAKALVESVIAQAAESWRAAAQWRGEGQSGPREGGGILAGEPAYRLASEPDWDESEDAPKNASENARLGIPVEQPETNLYANYYDGALHTMDAELFQVAQLENNPNAVYKGNGEYFIEHNQAPSILNLLEKSGIGTRSALDLYEVYKKAVQQIEYLMLDSAESDRKGAISRMDALLAAEIGNGALQSLSRRFNAAVAAYTDEIYS